MFDVATFLKSAGAERRIASYPKGRAVFSQGQPSDSCLFTTALTLPTDGDTVGGWK